MNRSDVIGWGQNSGVGAKCEMRNAKYGVRYAKHEIRGTKHQARDTRYEARDSVRKNLDLESIAKQLSPKRHGDRWRLWRVCCPCLAI